MSIDTVIGIDVSSKWLDIHVLPEGRTERFGNDPEGIASVVELSNELAKVHRAVDDLLVRRCDGLARLYRPGSWVPHITLAMGDLTQEAFDDARERLAEYDREYVVVADRISLVQSAPQDQGYEVLGQWAVGSTGSRSGRS